MNLFGHDPNDRPSNKKILAYCVTIVCVLLLLGLISEYLL